jgi:hypothetical protein
MQATNYTSRLNRRAKSHMQRWTVSVRYADSAANIEYQYRTESGARAKAAWYLEAMADPAKYGMSECPVIGVTCKETAR